MTRIEHSVVIERPVEDVWAYVSDPTNNTVWQGPVIEVDSLPTIEVGTEVTEVMKFLGRRVETTWVVTEHEPMHRSAVETSSGPVQMRGSYLLEPVDGGTRFTMETDMDAHGFFKLAEPVFARMARRKAVSSCETLKELLEAEAASGGTADSP